MTTALIVALFGLASPEAATPALELPSLSEVWIYRVSGELPQAFREALHDTPPPGAVSPVADSAKPEWQRLRIYRQGSLPAESLPVLMTDKGLESKNELPLSIELLAQQTSPLLWRPESDETWRLRKKRWNLSLGAMATPEATALLNELIDKSRDPVEGRYWCESFWEGIETYGPVSYLKYIRDDRYALKETAPEQVGYDTTQFLARPKAPGEEWPYAFFFSCCDIVNRAPVEGTTLPVGKPEFERAAFGTVTTAPLNEWLTLVCPMNALGTDNIFVCLRLVPMPKETALESGYTATLKVFRLTNRKLADRFMERIVTDPDAENAFGESVAFTAIGPHSDLAQGLRSLAKQGDLEQLYEPQLTLPYPVTGKPADGPCPGVDSLPSASNPPARWMRSSVSDEHSPPVDIQQTLNRFDPRILPMISQTPVIPGAKWGLAAEMQSPDQEGYVAAMLPRAGKGPGKVEVDLGFFLRDKVQPSSRNWLKADSFKSKTDIWNFRSHFSMPLNGWMGFTGLTSTTQERLVLLLHIKGIGALATPPEAPQ